VRPFICEFSGVLGTKAAAYAQPEGVTRWIFFDPFLSFDPTTLESRSSAGAEALASPLKKWSAQLSYSDHDRNGSPTQAVSAQFFYLFDRRPSELPGRRNLTQIVPGAEPEQA
jgi:hypothetical protein